MTGRSYSPEFKLQVVLEALSSDRADAEITRAYDIHPVTLSNWKRCLKEDGAKASGGDNDLKEKEQHHTGGIRLRRSAGVSKGLHRCVVRRPEAQARGRQPESGP